MGFDDLRVWVLAGLILLAGLSGAGAQEKSTAEQTVDVMNKLWGSHAGMRANHAKGLVTEGEFTPSEVGKSLSMAGIFAGGTIPVTVRFSNSTGLPTLPDGDRNANPHGMAIRFHQADGTDVDAVTNSLPFFPVKNGDEFRDLLTAVSQSGPDAPHPTPLETFIAGHPRVAAAGAGVSTPSSFARETYNGVDAFIFVDAAGKRQPFRFKIEPFEGDDHLSPDAAKVKSPNFLSEELRARLAKAPASFHLRAQLANPGDQTADPTQPWPADRKVVDLGTITITKVVTNSAAAEKELMYLPANLEEGIEQSDDPLIDARNDAYAVSFGRRQ
ncbi:catalase [Arboricoccus pini]|uniref:Catalase-related peroxidase n=1 Tax=Arboricoccus pini TaxID=1963835 RepID=A0A212RLT1_9PROT|nr:catalase family peroxidase [Arboricoccus pini]SNB73283.1 catalase [Arboricoccus pini]